MEPGEKGKTSIQVMTSVDGSAARWHNLLNGFLLLKYRQRSILIFMTLVQLGVVRLRLEQALEEIAHD